MERLDYIAKHDAKLTVSGAHVARMERFLAAGGQTREGETTRWDEIDRAILEPGGTICFFAKKPTPDTARHAELIARLDRISEQLATLRP